MRHVNRSAKVNVQVLVIVIVVTVALGVSLVVARQVRRRILSKMDYEAGTAAFEKGDWVNAYKHLQEYLGRNPDDLEMLKKYAEARLSVRPSEPVHLGAAVGAYRRVVQLDPNDEVAYEKLATIYSARGAFDELVYIAGKRLEHEPNDVKASLWQSQALAGLNRLPEARETLGKLIERLESDPQEHLEYVRACAQMSSLEIVSGTPEAMTAALGWLNKAVDRFPQSAEALASRARFYRLAEIPGMSGIQRRELARQDLIAADQHGADDPRTRLFLAREWMVHGEYDKASAELEAADGRPEAAIAERYFDRDTWVVDRYDVASELALRKGAFDEGVAMTEAVFEKLESPGHRLAMYPNAIRLCVGAANRIKETENDSEEAEKRIQTLIDEKAVPYLKEYEAALYARQRAGEAKPELAFLKALVAGAKGDSYAVIEALQPLVAAGTQPPEFLRLLADAFTRTNQPRRAVEVMGRYLQNRPNDLGILVQLTREYLRLQDWTRAFETAQLACRLRPDDVDLNVLRIETGACIVAGQQGAPDVARLRELDAELAKLREDQKNARRVDIRVLQAVIGMYLAQGEADAAVKKQQLEDVEKQLRLAMEECDEPLRATLQLVRLYLQQGQMTKAIQECRAACSQHADQAEPWLALAGLHVANSDPNSALGCLEEAARSVGSEPGKRAITIRCALLELQRGDRQAGIARLSDLAADDPNDPHEIQARAILLDQREIQRDTTRADELVAQLEKAEGESGLTWRLYRAATWLSRNEWRSRQQGIVDLLQYCRDADPEWTAPALLMAQLYEKAGDLQKVEEVCRQVLARNPSAILVADKLVSLLEAQGRQADAAAVRQQVDADPRVLSGWNINAAIRAGDISSAVRELRNRIADPRDVQSRVLLARLLFEKANDADQALAVLDEAEAIASPSITTVGIRAAILRAQGHAEQAQEVMDRYVAEQDDFTAYLMRANYHASQEQWERAEADYKRLTTFEDKDQQVAGYALLSSFYVRRDRLDDGIGVLEERLAAHPEDLTLQRALMKRLFQRGQGRDREKAVAMLDALEKELLGDPDLMKTRAVELLRQGDLQGTTLLEKVVTQTPTDVSSHLMLIDIAMQSGQLEAARAYSIQAVGANPEHPALLSARGRVEVVLGNPSEAMEMARSALTEDPNYAPALDVLLDVGLMTKQDGLLREVVQSARAVGQNDPNRTEALRIISSKAAGSRNPALLEAAKEWIESELSRTPADVGLLTAHASVLVALGTPQKGIDELTAYCESEAGSKDLDAVVMLVDLHRISGNLEQAYAWIDRAAQIAPKSQTVLHAKVLCLLTQERWADLAGISAAYIACEDQSPTIVTRAAGILVSLDTAALQNEGVKLFEHAVDRWPALPDAQLGLASALYRTGNTEKAKRTYQKLLDGHPNNTQVLNDLAWILQEQDRDYATALDLANKGLSLRGTQADRRHLLDTRGTILSKMDRLPEARADFEELLKLTEPNTAQRARTLLHLGRICAKLEDVDAAKEHLQEALQIDQASPVFTPEERTEIEGLLR